MRADKINGQYFEWLCSKVECPAQYSKLMSYLYDTEFVYTIDMDENRAEDGISLRCQFGSEQCIHDGDISEAISNRPCSMLEMMVALSMRCETHIMSNSEYGDRTSKWFWDMVRSLGLDRMSDIYFDYDMAEKIMSRLMSHSYNRNGSGGLFTINSRNHDMRTAEIWYQMCWYLDTIT